MPTPVPSSMRAWPQRSRNSTRSGHRNPNSQQMSPSLELPASPADSQQDRDEQLNGSKERVVVRAKRKRSVGSVSGSSVVFAVV